LGDLGGQYMGRRMNNKMAKIWLRMETDVEKRKNLVVQGQVEALSSHVDRHPS
jgi:hypothetical protein